MRFDSDEIYLLYQINHIRITKKQAETIFLFTEGWPIEINALLISGVNIPSKSMPQDQLESFLKIQVWDTWDENIRNFILGTIVEEELTERICNELLGITDSGNMLELLLSRGCFLYRRSNGSYCFHKLFREFLLKQFHEQTKEYCEDKFRLAGEFYLKQKDFYRALERFSNIQNFEYIAQCFDLLEEIDRAGFDTERVMLAVRDDLNEEIAEQYPYLFFMMAFTARNDGRIEDFKRFADLYYANYSRVIERNPELAHNIFFLYIMDYRFTIEDITRMASGGQSNVDFQGVRGSATAYFPLYHRSFRDFSEVGLAGIDNGMEIINQTLGALLGEEREMVIECLRAGLYYERGELLHAQELSLLAAAKIRNSFVPESKFCALMLLLSVDYALHQFEQADIIQQEIRLMIENEKAFYLQFNFDAVICKNLLYSGDVNIAQTWLKSHDAVIGGHLTFFHLNGNFTAARAHITCGSFDKAIILLHEIYNFCSQMGRYLDIIESEILLAIAYWKKKRGYQKTALSYLEDAIKIAQPFEYEQIFISEGAELESMLSRLKSRMVRSDYKGEIFGPFVKKLYIGVAQQALYSKGLTGGRVENSLQFTKQQKKVMRLLCDGYSYRQIGETLGIQFSTVRSHVELIYKKLDVSGVKDAIIKIRELNALGDE